MKLDYNVLDMIFEILGTISFAFSGAMVGIKRGMDLFGVMALGVVTALGGGLVRDLILGNTPPVMFRDSRMAIYAIVSSVLLFMIFYIRFDIIESKWMRRITLVMMLFDALGLGAFTVTGITTALNMGFEYKFLLLFVGVLTGVGGGALRDVFASEIPAIFKEQIYAVASFLGAMVYISLIGVVNLNLAKMLAFMVVFMVRLMAITFDMHLPRIDRS
ncbi:TRIC cation channel family protein [Peptoniphilus duerdenii]|uniref:trimeric intracellular cation channel family protein n=1 Tax=Peptoniphilus duerdenii TaxID=507750 RepID=UPI0023EF92B9|nr:TRIC cation channel family protein [Peptoniphilus duerdenii]